MHTAQLGLIGIGEEMVREYEDFESSKKIPEFEKAVLTIALKSTTTPRKITDGEIEAVKRFGFSDGEIIQILLLANFHSMLARMNESLGVTGGALAERSE